MPRSHGATVWRVLFDSDVLLDVLLAREPHVAASAQAVDTVPRGTVEGYVAGHAVTNVYYVLRRQVGDRQSRALLANLLVQLTLAPVTDRAIRAALASPFTEFEDAVSHAVAVETGVDVSVTRNTSDFAQSVIPALAPGVYVASTPAADEPTGE